MVVPSVADMVTVVVVDTLLPISTLESWPTRIAAENAGTPLLAPIWTRPLSQSKSIVSLPRRAPGSTTSRLFEPVSLIWMFSSIAPGYSMRLPSASA